MPITREEIITRMMPFSKEIKEWCKQHPEFAEALKINNPSRFIAFQAIGTSYSPFVTEDEVIGFYVYDSQQKKIKQDYIINKGKLNREFVLYTKLPNRNYSKYVRDINEFREIYSKGKYYINAHHMQFDDLPEQVKSRATQAISLGERLKITGLRELTEDELVEFESKLQELGL